MDKKEFMEYHGLYEKNGEIVDFSGNFIAGICPQCGLIQASGSTANCGRSQPEYCRCDRK